MKIVKLPLPTFEKDGVDYSAYDDHELSRAEIKNLPASVKNIWYWYGTGCYDGVGQMLAEDESGRWVLLNMGHCSCNGPIDEGDLDFSTGMAFDALYARCSASMKREVKCLFDKARKDMENEKA